MLRRLAFVFAALGACAPARALAPALAPAPAPPSPSCLSIVAWGDMHGQLAPDVVTLDTGAAPAGGVVAVADAVAAVRATGDAVVVLDAGDLFTGPLESSFAEGAPVIAAYDVIGVDAVAIGNHEFDFGPVGYDRVTAVPGKGDEAGPDGPRGALLARMSEAKFPFLAANVFTTAGGRPAWPGYRASTRVARGGFDVGVVGYTTRETPTTTLKPNVVGLDFDTHATDGVAAEIRALRAAGAYPIVLLAHASLEGELPQELDDPKDPAGANRTGEIARLVDALGADRPDVIVAGHRHAWLLGRVRGVPVVSSDQHGVGVARVRYCRAAGGGPPVLDRVEREVTMATLPPASALGREVARTILPFQEKVARQAAAEIATIPRGCAAQSLDGTALAEQVARAIAEHAAVAGPLPAGTRVVGLMNTGGIRAPLRAGAVRFADLFAVSPFENAVSVCVTTRAGLARVVGNALGRPSVRERFPFGIAGARVTVKRDAGGAATLLEIDLDGDAAGAARDGDVLALALPDFLLWGGDGLLDGVTCASTGTSQLRVRDAWREVLAREKACDGAPKDVVVERRVPHD